MEKVHTPKRVAAQPGQRGKIALIAAGCAAAVLLAAYLGLCAWVGGSPNILKGVSVAGVPVGGLTREQALETLEDNLGQVSSVALPLEYGPWEGEITAAADRERLRQLGDIVTANLHAMTRGQARLTAVDFYDPEMKEIDIPLSPQLSPQQNAAKYYKDYARAKSAQEHPGSKGKRSQILLSLGQGPIFIQMIQRGDIAVEIFHIGVVYSLSSPDRFGHFFNQPSGCRSCK